MKRYIYNYQTIVTFSESVVNHAVLLRCQPSVGSYMTVDEEHLIISPGFRLTRGIDQLGNRIVYGAQRDAHASLAYVSAGLVTMSPYVIRSERGVNPVYLVQTRMTDIGQDTFDADATGTADGGEVMLGHIAEVAMEICHKVYGMMTYVPFSTNVENMDMLTRFGYPYRRLSLAYDSLKRYCKEMTGALDANIESQLDNMIVESKFNLDDPEFKGKLIKYINQLVRV